MRPSPLAAAPAHIQTSDESNQRATHCPRRLRHRVPLRVHRRPDARCAGGTAARPEAAHGARQLHRELLRHAGRRIVRHDHGDGPLLQAHARREDSRLAERRLRASHDDPGVRHHPRRQRSWRHGAAGRSGPAHAHLVDRGRHPRCLARRRRGVVMAPAQDPAGDGILPRGRGDHHARASDRLSFARCRNHGSHWRQMGHRHGRPVCARCPHDTRHRSVRTMSDSRDAAWHECQVRLPDHDGRVRIPDAGGGRSVHPRARILPAGDALDGDCRGCSRFRWHSSGSRIST